MSGGFISLIQSLDPLFPVGSFTLSNGMETYVNDGVVKDGKSLLNHLRAYLYNISFNELAFAARAYSTGGDNEKLEELDMLLSAFKAPSELRSASIKQCARFLKLQKDLGEYQSLENYMRLIQKGKCSGHYAIALGLLIGDLDIKLEEALHLYCYSLLSSMTNHAAKLVPLRQADAQKALKIAAADIPKAAARAMRLEADEIGASGAGFDLSSMRHERLYSRVYIS